MVVVREEVREREGAVVDEDVAAVRRARGGVVVADSASDTYADSTLLLRSPADADTPVDVLREPNRYVDTSMHDQGRECNIRRQDMPWALVGAVLLVLVPLCWAVGEAVVVLVVQLSGSEVQFVLGDRKSVV